MANKTIADRILSAYDTGKEAKFHSTDETSTGTEYEFTPDGLAAYISAEALVTTGAELVSAGGNITIPAGSTLNAALQLIIDAVDPEV